MFQSLWKKRDHQLVASSQNLWHLPCFCQTHTHTVQAHAQTMHTKNANIVACMYVYCTCVFTFVFILCTLCPHHLMTVSGFDGDWTIFAVAGLSTVSCHHCHVCTRYTQQTWEEETERVSKDDNSRKYGRLTVTPLSHCTVKSNLEPYSCTTWKKFVSSKLSRLNLSLHFVPYKANRFWGLNKMKTNDLFHKQYLTYFWSNCQTKFM